jgi:hypothetical protein
VSTKKSSTGVAGGVAVDVLVSILVTQKKEKQRFERMKQLKPKARLYWPRT